MRLLKILLIAMLFLNCNGQTNKPVYTYEVSEALQPYVFDYMVHLKKYDIQFKKQTFIVVFDADIMRTLLLGTAKGMLHDDLVYVKINPREWGRLSHKQRRHTIFHELSHDLFNTKHTFEIELMKPAIPTDAESFAMNIDKAIDELMKYIKNGNRR